MKIFLTLAATALLIACNSSEGDNADGNGGDTATATGGRASSTDGGDDSGATSCEIDADCRCDALLEDPYAFPEYDHETDGELHIVRETCVLTGNANQCECIAQSANGCWLWNNLEPLAEQGEVDCPAGGAGGGGGSP
ncbi:MAG TPA: hypothetical protein VLC09_14820 [Polyangiaceae bacterium]|nr:hypothetical protein [Polyangiaceae bacterium]